MRRSNIFTTPFFNRFQSTHPLRDATISTNFWDVEINDFNPRTPYGMRRCKGVQWWWSQYFNPRTPYGMRRWQIPSRWIRHNFNPRTPYGMRLGIYLYIDIHIQYFNPRTPYGMRQRSERLLAKFNRISIHAPLTGCDRSIAAYNERVINFNPRTPYGMRLV